MHVTKVHVLAGVRAPIRVRDGPLVCKLDNSTRDCIIQKYPQLELYVYGVAGGIRHYGKIWLGAH